MGAEEDAKATAIIEEAARELEARNVDRQSKDRSADNRTLKNLLSEWTAFDVAEFYLACALGLMKWDDWPTGTPIPNKWIFWSNNPIGNMLHKTLEAIVQAGILEENGDNQFRWNASFVADWDK